LDTYADDLAALVTALDLKNAIHVGHSTGGGEVARYIGRHGTKRVAKAVLIGAIPPLMVKTPANPGGTPIAAFDQLRSAVQADRSKFWLDLNAVLQLQPPRCAGVGSRAPVVLAARDDVRFSRVVFLHQGVFRDGFDQDLKRIDVPTLILHGDDDQIVPIADSALLSAEIIKVRLVVYKGAPRGAPEGPRERGCSLSSRDSLVRFARGGCRQAGGRCVACCTPPRCG
jgi:non-heme chloroperoxidase